jgi:MOSC domain-containing protein YiiM
LNGFDANPTWTKRKSHSPIIHETANLFPVQLLHLYTSPGHNYFGHHGKPAGTHPIREVESVECVAGRGLVGDRFFDFKDDYKGQVTFFSHEVFEELCATLGLFDRTPDALRRNIITRGIDLNDLIGEEFEVQGIRFLGTTECKPCYWMDQAIGPGAEDFLKGRGGLRAKILTSGVLQRDAVTADSR